MRPLLVLLAATLAACAAHPAAAAGPTSLDATVAGMLVDGRLSVAGPLAALASTGQVETDASLPATLLPAAANAPRLAPTALRLAAHRLHAETDVSRQTGSPAANSAERTTEALDFANAVAHTTQAREGFQVYLAPLAGHPAPLARLDAMQARLEPTGAVAGEPERRVTTSRAPLEAAGGPAAVVSGGLRTLHLVGDFALTLWEWDLEVSSDGTLLRSGYAYTPLAPSVAGRDTVGRSEGRQVFVVAEGASLDLTLPSDAAVTLALQPTALDFDGRLVLQAPKGTLRTLSGEQPLRDGDWVDGRFTAQLSGLTDSSLHASVGGTGRQARLAGLTLAIAPPVPSTTGALVATLAASGIAVLGGWRIWGRRPTPLPLVHLPAAQEGDDELRTLRWLEARAGQAASVLWDSDLMRAFDWSAERAQLALLGLQAKGQVRCKDVALAADRTSLGHIALTAAGLARLREGDALPASPPGGLRRLVPGRAR